MTKRSVSTHVFQSLRDRIISGELSPNEPLTEAKICQAYSVSRATVRRALQLLEKDELVIIEENKSVKIKIFTLSEILDMLDVRIPLERYVVLKATKQITSEQINELQNTVSTMKEYIEENKLLEYHTMNHRFHSIIYNACPNKYALEMVSSLKAKISRFSTKTILVPGRSIQSLSEHIDLCNAICERNAEKASELMEKHVMNVKNTLMRYSSILF